MTKPPEFIIDPQSTYYQHPSNAPGAIITALKFDRKNFEMWEKAVSQEQGGVYQRDDHQTRHSNRSQTS